VIAVALQRCAACGGSHDGGECPACRARRLGHASSLVHETLNRPGRPLERDVRRDFERTLGHDFGAVRVHTDETAAASAAAVQAQAYTVGANVVFGAGRYRPASVEGRRLLAHELTHVRQQAGAPAGGPLRIVDDPAAEAEASSAARTVTPRPVAVQRQPERSGLLSERLRPPPPPLLIQPGSLRETFVLPAPPVVELGPPTLLQPRERFPGLLDTPSLGPLPFTPVTLIRVSRCVPDRALTWADFQGTPPSGTFAAFTRVNMPELDVQGNVMFRAVLNNAQSWVRPHVVGAGARATNRCAPLVTQCQNEMAAAGSGATWSRTPPTGCAATPFTPATATTVAECDTVVGAACDADAVADSARLLAHEQGHFDIACTLVGRADDALAAGTPLATVRTWLSTHAQPQQTAYDNDTHHGCDAAQQSAWETSIAADLPGVPAP
jgi:hypothetical protein